MMRRAADDRGGPRKFVVPGLDYVLDKKERVIISDVWTAPDKGLVRVGVAV